MEQEIWKDIEGYEGFYKVSSFGNVKSLYRVLPRKNGGNYAVREKLLKLSVDGDGYYRVALRKDGISKYCSIHRLVANAFIPNPKNLPCINHKDEVKTNNNVCNLEWCTYSYNNTYNDLAHRRLKNVDFKKRAMNTDWAKRKQNTDFVKRTQNTDYEAIAQKRRIPVEQYTPEGVFVRTWNSAKEAALFYNCTADAIRANCCGGVKGTTRGYIWKYGTKSKGL